MADQIEGLRDALAYNYITMSAFVLLVYDSVLTFPREIKYIWTGKIGLVPILYLLARYAYIVYFLGYTIVTAANIPDKRCLSLIHFLDTMWVASLLGVQFLLITRTWAICGRSRIVLAVLGLLSLASIILPILQTTNDYCAVAGPGAKLLILEGIISGVVQLVFDTAVVAFTLYHTIGKTWRLHKGLNNVQRSSLLRLLVHQGILRFGFMFSFQLTNMVTTLVLPPNLFGVISPVKESLSVIIVCRFLLDIRERNAHPNMTSGDSIPLASPMTSFVAPAPARHLRDTLVEDLGDAASSSMATTLYNTRSEG